MGLNMVIPKTMFAVALLGCAAALSPGCAGDDGAGDDGAGNGGGGSEQTSGTACTPDPCTDKPNQVCDPASGQCVCQDNCPVAGAGQCADGQGRTCEPDSDGCLQWSEYRDCSAGFCFDAERCASLQHAQWGTEEFSEGCSVAVDAQGNAFVAGTVEGLLDGAQAIGEVGSSDLFVSRLNADNTEAWTNQWGTRIRDIGVAVAVGENGDVYTGGSSYMGGGGGTGALLARWTADGEQVWRQMWGRDETYNDAASLAVDQNGDVIVAGSVLDLLVDLSEYGEDLFVARFTPDGSMVWSQQWGVAAVNDIARSVAIDADGNIYLAGSTEGELDGESHAGGGMDAFLVKLGPDSERIWTRVWGSAEEDEGHGVAVSSGGEVYVTGTTQGEMEAGADEVSDDAFLTKWTAQGDQVWTRQWGGNSYDSALGLALESGGTILVAGETNGEMALSQGWKDAFVTRYDPDGVQLLNLQFGSDENDGAESIAVGADGRVYVAGSTNGSLGAENAGEVDCFLTVITAE